jgi:hypothetical protein
MPTNSQKDLWRKEKEELLRDKQNQPREVRRRAVNLSLGGAKKKPTPSPNNPTGSLDNIPDDILRKRLGI